VLKSTGAEDGETLSKEQSPASRLYPKLVVDSGRASGSIIIDEMGLALWAITNHCSVRKGWNYIARDYDISADIFSGEDYSDFLHHLLESRGEIARLLCVLADVERQESEAEAEDWCWWETDRKERVVAQLERCIEVLREKDGNPWG